jgi:uncharacterized protein (DUF488 family)
MSNSPAVWTIGHSNHDIESFVGLVLRNEISHVVDVRSYPYSRFVPQFNREELRATLAARDVNYLFLGHALGGRPERDEHFDEEGHALYGDMAQEPAFKDAIHQLLRGASQHRLALMCSCGQPRDCHRRLLVGKVLCDHGAELRHILPDGSLLDEKMVPLMSHDDQVRLFGHDEQPWRSAQSVSRRRRLSTSSAG